MTYKRTYFNTPDGRSYLLDNILGVESYDRIDAGVSAGLVNTAAKHSYGRSTDIITGGEISRQSVRNKLMNTGEVVYIPERAAVDPDAIHIFADEDHVNLQDGSNAIVPLITVCEGKREVCKGRNELREPFHAQGYGMKPEEFWEYVYALCAEKYDMGNVNNVYIYGDGAAWIMKGLDVFPAAEHILDTFHFKKRMKSLLAGEISASFSIALRRAVNKNDKVQFDYTVRNMINAVYEKMPEGKARDGRLKVIRDNAGYILKYWDALQNIAAPYSIGSSTEAMVSHVLSERLSRNPMGWSKAGLSKMSMVRVFVQNGGKVESADTGAWKNKADKCKVITNLEKYEAIVQKQQDEIFKDAKNWRWFEVENLISGKTTGTKVVLDALAQTRNVS
jgi:hypothetical protein